MGSIDEALVQRGSGPAKVTRAGCMAARARPMNMARMSTVTSMAPEVHEAHLSLVCGGPSVEYGNPSAWIQEMSLLPPQTLMFLGVYRMLRKRGATLWLMAWGPDGG